MRAVIPVGAQLAVAVGAAAVSSHLWTENLGHVEEEASVTASDIVLARYPIAPTNLLSSFRFVVTHPGSSRPSTLETKIGAPLSPISDQELKA